MNTKAKILSLCLAAVLLCGCIVGFMMTGASAADTVVKWTVDGVGDDSGTNYETLQAAMEAAEAKDWAADETLTIQITRVTAGGSINNTATDETLGEYTIVPELMSVDEEGVLFGVDTIWRADRTKLPITIQGKGSNNSGRSRLNLATVDEEGNLVACAAPAEGETLVRAACSNDYRFYNIDFRSFFGHLYAGNGTVKVTSIANGGSAANKAFSADNFTAAVYRSWTEDDVAAAVEAGGGKIQTALLFDVSSSTTSSSGSAVQAAALYVVSHNTETDAYENAESAEFAATPSMTEATVQATRHARIGAAVAVAGNSPVAKATLNVDLVVHDGAKYGARYGAIQAVAAGVTANCDVVVSYKNGNNEVKSTATTLVPSDATLNGDLTVTLEGFTETAGFSVGTGAINGDVVVNMGAVDAPVALKSYTGPKVVAGNLTNNFNSVTCSSTSTSVASFTASTATITGNVTNNITGCTFTTTSTSTTYITGVNGTCKKATNVIDKDLAEDQTPTTISARFRATNGSAENIENIIYNGVFSTICYLGPATSSAHVVSGSVTNTIYGGTFNGYVYLNMYDGIVNGTSYNYIYGGTFTKSGVLNAHGGTLGAGEDTEVAVVNVFGQIDEEGNLISAPVFTTAVTLGGANWANADMNGTYGDIQNIFYGGEFVNVACAPGYGPIQGDVENTVYGGDFGALFYTGSKELGIQGYISTTIYAGSFKNTIYGGTATGDVTITIDPSDAETSVRYTKVVKGTSVDGEATIVGVGGHGGSLRTVSTNPGEAIVFDSINSEDGAFEYRAVNWYAGALHMVAPAGSDIDFGQNESGISYLKGTYGRGHSYVEGDLMYIESYDFAAFGGYLSLGEKISVHVLFDKAEALLINEGLNYVDPVFKLNGETIADFDWRDGHQVGAVNGATTVIHEGKEYLCFTIDGISPADLNAEITYSGNTTVGSFTLNQILEATKAGASAELVELCEAIQNLGGASNEVAVGAVDMDGAYAEPSEAITGFGIVMNDAVGYTLYAADAATAAATTYTVKVNDVVVEGAAFNEEGLMDIFVKVARADEMMKIEVLEGETSRFIMEASVAQVAATYVENADATNILAYIQAANAYQASL